MYCTPTTGGYATYFRQSAKIARMQKKLHIPQNSHVERHVTGDAPSHWFPHGLRYPTLPLRLPLLYHKLLSLVALFSPYNSCSIGYNTVHSY